MLALSRKLCPLFSLFMLMNCGKKITEPSGSSDSHLENQIPSPTLTIAIEGRSKIYNPNRRSNMSLPSHLRVRSNNALGKVVAISYNVLPADHSEYEFKCIYRGTAENTMPIEKCVDRDGYDIGDVADGRFHPMDEDRLIKFESNSDTLKADAFYEVNWK